MELLEQRLQRLEKNLKLYRLIIVSILCAGLAFLLMSNGKKAFVPAKVQAKAFELVDDNGNVLAVIGKDGDNGSVTTYARDGKRSDFAFTANGGGGCINSFDNNGQVNFKVTRTTDGGGYMALFNGDKKEIFEAGSTTASSGYFRINDRYGQKLAWLTFTEGGGGYFGLMGKDNKEQIKMSTPGVGGRISTYNSNEKRTVFIGAQDNKDGNITVYDASGIVSGNIPK